MKLQKFYDKYNDTVLGWKYGEMTDRDYPHKKITLKDVCERISKLDSEMFPFQEKIDRYIRMAEAYWEKKELNKK